MWDINLRRPAGDAVLRASAAASGAGWQHVANQQRNVSEQRSPVQDLSDTHGARVARATGSEDSAAAVALRRSAYEVRQWAVERIGNYPDYTQFTAGDDGIRLDYFCCGMNHCQSHFGRL